HQRYLGAGWKDLSHGIADVGRWGPHVEFVHVDVGGEFKFFRRVVVWRTGHRVAPFAISGHQPPATWPRWRQIGLRRDTDGVAGMTRRPVRCRPHIGSTDA